MPTSITTAPVLTICGTIRFGLARGDHEDVGEDRELGKIARFGVADADGGVALHQHQRHGLADDVARPDNHHIRAFERYSLMLEQFEDAIRRARRKDGVAQHQAADVVQMKSVDVFLRRNGAQHFCDRELGRQRQLHQNSVDRRVRVQRGNAIDTAAGSASAAKS